MIEVRHYEYDGRLKAYRDLKLPDGYYVDVKIVDNHLAGAHLWSDVESSLATWTPPDSGCNPQRYGTNYPKTASHEDHAGYSDEEVECAYTFFKIVKRILADEQTGDIHWGFAPDIGLKKSNK